VLDLRPQGPILGVFSFGKLEKLLTPEELARYREEGGGFLSRHSWVLYASPWNVIDE
jgi:hypothetical protein